MKVGHLTTFFNNLIVTEHHSETRQTISNQCYCDHTLGHRLLNQSTVFVFKLSVITVISTANEIGDGV